MSIPNIANPVYLRDHDSRVTELEKYLRTLSVSWHIGVVSPTGVWLLGWFKWCLKFILRQNNEKINNSWQRSIYHWKGQDHRTHPKSGMATFFSVNYFTPRRQSEPQYRQCAFVIRKIWFKKWRYWNHITGFIFINILFIFFLVKLSQ